MTKFDQIFDTLLDTQSFDMIFRLHWKDHDTVQFYAPDFFKQISLWCLYPLVHFHVHDKLRMPDKIQVYEYILLLTTN